MRALIFIDPVFESNYYHKDSAEYVRGKFYEFIFRIGRHSYTSKYGDITDLFVSCGLLFILRQEIGKFK